MRKASSQWHGALVFGKDNDAVMWQVLNSLAAVELDNQSFRIPKPVNSFLALRIYTCPAMGGKSHSLRGSLAAVASESSLRVRSLMISSTDLGLCICDRYVKRKIKLNQLIRRSRSNSPRKEIQYFVPN